MANLPSMPKCFPNGTPLTEIVMSDNEEKTDASLLSVASYNLLAPVYVRPYDKRTGGIQPFAAFEWVSNDDVLEMETRGPRLLESLCSNQADLICLQELQLDRNEEGQFVLQPWIRPIVQDHGYQLCLPPKLQLDKIAERNVRVLDCDAAVTCGILYRTDRLREVPCNKDKDDNTNTCVSACFQGRDGSSLQSMDPLVVTSLHLDATDEKKRTMQLSRCLQQSWNRQTCANATALEPLSAIIAGDMNTECGPGSCVAAFLDTETPRTPSDADMMKECASNHRLLNGQLPSDQQYTEWKNLYSETLATVRDSCVSLRRVPTGATRSAYDHDDSNSQQQEPTMAQWRLDHIFYTDGTLQPYAYWSTLEDDQLSCDIGLPNHKHGSDHLPIAAVFQVLHAPRLADEEKQVLLDRIHQLVADQSKEIETTEAVFKYEMENIQANLPAPNKGRGYIWYQQEKQEEKWAAAKRSNRVDTKETFYDERIKNQTKKRTKCLVGNPWKSRTSSG